MKKELKVKGGASVSDPWHSLKQYTDARIALGRAGTSLPTQHHLNFQMDHANAKDAIEKKLDWPSIEAGVEHCGVSSVRLKSQINDRDHYLQRPDLGRCLDVGSVDTLQSLFGKDEIPQQHEICIVITDGLSSLAIEENAINMVNGILSASENLAKLKNKTIFLVEQGRVAVGDEIAEITQAKHLIVLIGERPGLSSPNSLGVYYTYNAKKACSDADRNCLSNIRDGGQSIESACQRLMWLMTRAEELDYSGVNLKDDSQKEVNLATAKQRNFLIKVNHEE